MEATDAPVMGDCDDCLCGHPLGPYGCPACDEDPITWRIRFLKEAPDGE